MRILIVSFSNDQVNNRDISIAVLRTFISKRKEDHEARLSKRAKAAPKVSEEDASEPVLEVANESVVKDGISNGKSELPEEKSQDESCGHSEDLVKNTEGKRQGELKPPRVLEVFLIFFFQ